MTFEPRTRYLDPDYAPKTMLFPRCAITRTPIIGTVLYDDETRHRLVRDRTKITVEFPPVYIYHVADALLTGEYCVHKKNELYLDSSIKLAQLGVEGVSHVTDAMAQMASRADGPIVDDFAEVSAFVSYNEGSGTWGHWLIHNFPRILSYLNRFPNGKIVVPRSLTIGVSNFAALFEIFGISRERLIAVERDRVYRFKELLIMDFLYDFRESMPNPAALDLLEIAARGIKPAAEAPRHLFTNRSHRTGGRAISNIVEVERCFLDHNVAVSTLGSQPVKAQIEAWQGANFIASILGSDLANIVFGRPNTRVLAITPDWFGDRVFYNLAAAKGMHWNELFCGRAVSELKDKSDWPFWVDVERLSAMLTELAG